MEFPVPQFIEMETKIVGPLTWRQFLLLGGAAAILFFLWFIVRHLLWFILMAIFIGGAAMSLAFLQIGGQSLPALLKNFLSYSVASKIYLWRKKRVPPKLIFEKKVEIGREEIEKAPLLKIVEKSRLRDLSTQIETRTK